ncbi:hypothetical protein CSAL01_11697 [Colletotrichum salicis]|uniref:Uncharacterized protein n=1 Tax=Colletotrichum salicis TaxID=1209931 RepID=A0A135UV66_9PEZI|nr:hypothetical protein CSAL01_11697 [Colletotrichum salicis]
MNTRTATATTTTMMACNSVAATFFSTAAAKLPHRPRQYNTKWCDGADGSIDYDFCAVEDEEEKENENECWWEDSLTEDYDMLLEFSNEEPHQQKPPVPSIMLTTTEGNVFFGNTIPEGTWCTEPRESLNLRTQYVANAETYLCPGNWLKIRDNNRRQEAEDAVLAYEKREEALHPKGSGSWRKRLARVNARSQRRRARQQKLREPERLW